MFHFSELFFNINHLQKISFKMVACLDCLTVQEVPTVSAADRCTTKHRKAGFQALFAIYCGVKLTADAPQDPIAALLAGADMPFNLAAQHIATTHTAPALTVDGTIIEMAQWSLLGYFGDSMRGSMQRQDAITHQGGSCEQPTLANNTWRAMFTFTKTGGAGNNGDYDMIKAILTNQKSYHLVAVECYEAGETPSAVVFPAGSFVFSEYGFNRSEDGVKEFVTRNFAVDFVQLLEPKSYAFPVFEDVMGVFQ